MNILSFINSKDIREHLKKTGYKFSSLEAAWIIHHSRKATLDEKIEAWNELMETMPDCRIDERRGFNIGGSLFETLKAYIRLMRKLISEMTPESPQLQKALMHRCYKYEYEQECRPVYKTFDAFTDFLKGWKNEDKEGITGYRIETVFTEDKGIITGTISVRFNSDLKVMSVDAYGDKYFGVQSLLHDFFQSMWFDFPVPFSKGDIIWDPEKKEGLCAGPFVVNGVGLKYISSEKTKEHVRMYGDSTDMNAWGTFIGEEGGIYDEVMENYMDCEYYPGPFTGKYAVLKAVSSFRKGEISDTLFARAYHAIRLRLMAENSVPQDYTEEIMESAGITEQDVT